MDESVKKVLDDQAKAQAEATAKQNKIEALMKEFPDLAIKTDRWRTQRYSSKSVNAIADKVDFKHNCGCCNDSPLEARPYIEFMGEKIHSDPDYYVIGEKNTWAGWFEDAYPDWEAGPKKHGISQKAIDRMAAYLEAHKAPERPEWNDEDDDNNE